MSEHDSSGVRITNAQIFEELRKTRTDVAAVQQSVDEVLKPGLADLRADVRNLDRSKADKTETAKLEVEINSVRVQAYSIGGGVLAGLIALRTLGVI